jgi:hypothetical protein
MILTAVAANYGEIAAEKGHYLLVLEVSFGFMFSVKTLQDLGKSMGPTPG